MQDVVINHNTRAALPLRVPINAAIDRGHVFNIKGAQKPSKHTLNWTNTLTINCYVQALVRGVKAAFA